MKLKGILNFLMDKELELVVLDKIEDCLVIEIRYRGIAKKHEIYKKVSK